MIAVTIDGRLVAPDEATVSIFDRGFLYGDGLFEVLRTWEGVALDLDAHLDRLCTSAAALSLAVDRGRIAEDVRRAIGAAGEGEHRLRIIVTRGAGPIGARLATLPAGRTIVIAEPLGALPASVSLAIVDHPLPRRVGAAHKTLAYLDHAIARELAAIAGADEAVRLGPDGDVVECATANLFIVAGGPAAPAAGIPPRNAPDAITGDRLEGVGRPTVVTPPVTAGILPGITRGRVIAACAALGIAVREQRISVEELRAADEIFVTSSVRGVVPVTALDGESRPAGALTQQLADAVRVLRARRAASSPNE